MASDEALATAFGAFVDALIYPAARALGAEGEQYALDLSWFPAGSEVPRVDVFSDARWAEALAAMRGGSVGSASVRLRRAPHELERSPGSSGLQIDVEFAHRSSTAAYVSDALEISLPSKLFCVVGASFLSHPIPLELERVLVDLFTSVGADLHASTGYLTLDRLATPYLLWAGRGTDQASAEGARWLPGYHWGELLSGLHINVLGGMERVKRDAPCAVVEELADSPEPLLYLQITEAIDDCPPDALRAMRDFLTPVLPPRDDRAAIPPRILGIESSRLVEQL
ncbi:MAG TPA: hypothetical protein VGO31_17885 [Microbacteriaceae bacterium]|nr:hypothetical protein [Microbacteriaceae bacterium]